MVFKSKFTLFLLLFLLTVSVFGQEIVTAGRYLEMVSEVYGGIRDYEANIAIRSGNQDMAGNVSHLSPNFMRIDFTKPAEQVIVFNGDLLSVYLPEFRVVLNQNISRTRRSNPNIATAQGLSLLRRNYVTSFVTGPNPEPLESGSREQVVKLRLTRNTTAEGFREIILSIDPDTKLIRRIEGRTIAEGEVRFDFTNVKLNQGIPEQRFLYDAPPTANIYNNFLFRDSD